MKELTIKGKWILSNDKIIKDSNCLLIEEMIINQLEVAGTSLDGWTITYRDEATGEIWELTYPKSYLHGGGPLTLTKLN